MKKVNIQTKFSIDKLLLLVNIVSIALIILIGVIFYFEITKPKQTYIAKSTEGKLTKIISLDEPNVSANTLLRWVSIAVTSAYTLDFVDYQESLNSLKQYFTKAGYTNFLTSADDRIQDIIKQKLIVTAVLTGTPVILGEGLTYGFYSWRIQVPILLSYQGASEKSTKQRLAVNLLVMRVPTKEAHTGIGIAQIQDVVTYGN